MNNPSLPQILILSSYPPRECGIGTYSQDLIKTLTAKFSQSFSTAVCAMETDTEKFRFYPDEVKYILNTTDDNSYYQLAKSLEKNARIKTVLIQHEFGFFKGHDEALLYLINELIVPVLVTFHTVLPNPNPALKLNIQRIVASCEGITVMTQNASGILQKEYGVPAQKISVIAHGTHLVAHTDKKALKEKYNVEGRTILSTFGLISSGKSIETTLDALPAIVEKNPAVLFLAIGKTHPSVVKLEGEKYREMLEQKVVDLNLHNHVCFINYYLPLNRLLEYLQLTDIYLFTSKDPNQAVSGTFSYAISCGCPIVSTPIPHAKEVLGKDTGIFIDFENAPQLSNAVNLLMGDAQLRKDMSSNGLHRIGEWSCEARTFIRQVF
jgi:glycosyltransferase involved in cell wall biosynthesis